MTIKREDIDNRQVDFLDVAAGRRLPSVHPGETRGSAPTPRAHIREIYDG